MMSFPEFCTGQSQFETRALHKRDDTPNDSPNAGQPYETISWDAIVALANDPPTVVKGKGRWIIPSSYHEHDARSAGPQKAHGRYWLLIADIDKGNPELATVLQAVRNVVGTVGFLIYSTRGATETNKKWRVMVLTAVPMNAVAFRSIQTAFNNALEAQGLILDRSTERATQIHFLPNRGEHYELHHEAGPPFGEGHPLIDAGRAVHEEWLAEEKKHSGKRKQHGPRSRIGAFLRRHPPEDILERAGFSTINGRDWHWDRQETGNYSTQLYEDGGIFTLSDSVRDHMGRNYFDGYDLACRLWGAEAVKKQAERYFKEDDAYFIAHGQQVSQQVLESLVLEKKTASVRVLSFDEFLDEFKSPEYLVDGVLQRGQVGGLTAQPNVGKTAVALYLSASVSGGFNFCERKVEKGKVLYLSGENPDDVRARMFGLQTVYGDQIDHDNIQIIPQVFDIPAAREALAQVVDDISLVIVDTLAAYYGGDDENNNTQIKLFVQELRKLTTLPGNPAVLILAHPTKYASTVSELLPRGGSSTWAEIDFNYTLRAVDGVLKLGHNKLRGLPFEDCSMQLTYTGHLKLVDKNHNFITTVVATPVTSEQATVAKQTEISCKDAILLYLKENEFSASGDILEDLSTGGLRGVKFGKSTIYASLNKLVKDKLLKQTRDRQYRLTNSGKEWLKAWEKRDSHRPETARI